MKTISDNEITETLQRVLPEITLAEIQELKANEAARERLKAEQGTLFFKIAAAMYRIDPESVAHDLNEEHEYEGEVGDIIPRLPECKNAQDCSRVIHEVCSKWFTGHVRSLERYQKIGAAIWELWEGEQLNKTGVFSN